MTHLIVCERYMEGQRKILERVEKTGVAINHSNFSTKTGQLYRTRLEMPQLLDANSSLTTLGVSTYTKVSLIPSSNCFASTLLV